VRVRSATTMTRKRRFFVVGLCVSIAIATLVALILVPVPQTFMMHEVAIYDLQTTCRGIATTRGTTVSFHWTAGGPTDFFVPSCSANRLAYQANGTQGVEQFVSIGGVYEFGSGCPGPGPCYPAIVAGTYTGPLLPL
jgi:hypothetical protein